MQYSVGPKLQELVNVFLLVHLCSLNSSLDRIKKQLPNIIFIYVDMGKLDPAWKTDLSKNVKQDTIQINPHPYDTHTNLLIYKIFTP